MSDKFGYHEEVIELPGTNQKEVLYALADHSGLKSNASFLRRGSDPVDDGQLSDSTFFAIDVREPSQMVPQVEVDRYFDPKEGLLDKYLIRIMRDGYKPGEVIAALKEEFGSD